MIDLKTILSAVARTFGISSPEDLRKQKRIASKPTISRVGATNQQAGSGPDRSSDDRSAGSREKP
ncbi:MAG TPA: hypothetical protein VKX41_15335 [Alloacidobacterium sp.]|nr:hypothetical protein [Alloacidobacterium sp.]